MPETTTPLWWRRSTAVWVWFLVAWSAPLPGISSLCERERDPSLHYCEHSTSTSDAFLIRWVAGSKSAEDLLQECCPEVTIVHRYKHMEGDVVSVNNVSARSFDFLSTDAAIDVLEPVSKCYYCFAEISSVWA